MAYLNPTSLLRTLWEAIYGGFIKGYLPTKIDGNVERMPADFLIGPEGVVLKAYYGSYPADHLPFAEIERLIELKEEIGSQEVTEVHPAFSHG